MKIGLLLILLFLGQLADAKDAEVTLCASRDSFADDLKFMDGCVLAGKTMSQAYRDGWRVKAMARVVDPTINTRLSPNDKIANFVLERN